MTFSRAWRMSLPERLGNRSWAFAETKTKRQRKTAETRVVFIFIEGIFSEFAYKIAKSFVLPIEIRKFIHPLSTNYKNTKTHEKQRNCSRKAGGKNILPCLQTVHQRVAVYEVDPGRLVLWFFHAPRLCA